MATAVCILLCATILFSQEKGTSQRSKIPPTSVLATGCGCDAPDCNKCPVRYYDYEAEDGGDLKRSDDGTPVAAQVEPFCPEPLRSTKLTGDVAVVSLSCRTNATNDPLGSGRKSCSDSEVHRLPAGFVFVENEATVTHNSDTGSDHKVDIVWLDRVEVIPGTGIMMARTMEVSGSVRSGSGTGERGHLDATIKCRFVRY